jgi:hypothetical protein
VVVLTKAEMKSNARVLNKIGTYLLFILSKKYISANKLSSKEKSCELESLERKKKKMNNLFIDYIL